MAAIGKKIHWHDLKYHWKMYFFIAPTIIIIAMFQYYPAASGIFHSFFRWNGADISEYVGFRNYTRLFENTDFWRSFELAFTLGVFNIVKMIPAFIVAVCLHRVRNDNTQFFYRILFVIQMVIPGLVIVLIWRSFFFEATAGYLNKFLFSTNIFDLLVWLDSHLHWGGLFVYGQCPAWLGDPKLIIVACIVWGFPWVGSFAVLNYLARLQSIPKDIYEAADVDGADWFTKFTRIEFPLVLESIKLILILVIIETIKDAGMILALAGIEGGPGGSATVPALFMLRKAFIEQDMGFACAVGIILTVVVISFQKMSEIITKWPELSTKKQVAIRTVALVTGVFLVHIGHFVSVGVGLLAIAFPYGTISWLLGKFFAHQQDANSTSDAPYHPINDSGSIIWRKWQDIGLRTAKHLTICSVILLAFLPLYLMFIVSLKNNDQFYSNPAVLTTPLHWINWKVAWEMITPCLANSVFISATSTLATLFLALCSSYFFARYQMPFSNFIWNAILILMMMPAIANLIPLFRLLRDLNLINTLSALIIVGASGGQIFAIFVLRSFVEDIPKDLFEAAEIDGASHFQQMMIIVVPLAGPILGTVGVMNFISQWNDFVMPLIVIRDHARLPVMVQLLRMAGEYIKLWGPLMAGYAMASIPVIVLFVLTMKLFTKGLTEGGVKG